MATPEELNLQRRFLNLQAEVNANLEVQQAHTTLLDPHPQYSLQEDTIAVHTILSSPLSAAVWTAQPAAQTMLFGSARHLVRLDISHFSQVSWQMSVESPGRAGATLELVYSPTYTTTPGDFLPIPPSGSKLDVDTAGNITSGWLDIDLAALATIYLGVRGEDGDGVVSPSFGQITVLFRG